jgi:hypothetical protein
VQPELVKAGVIYGLIPGLPTYGQPEPLQPPPAKLVRGTAHGHAVGTASSVYIMELSFSAANFFVCGSPSTLEAQAPAGFTSPCDVAFFLGTATHSPASPETANAEEEQTRNAILEMRPANRSLRDKAREEMSEFEREYPW